MLCCRRALLCRPSLVALLLATACAADALAQKASVPPGRQVTVRVFAAGTRYDPLVDTTLFGRTVSWSADRQSMGDPGVPGTQASGFVQDEANEGYRDNWLVKPPDSTGLEAYLPGNVPTYTCYCSGHVLLMVQRHLNRWGGRVPPLAAGGDLLWALAGTKGMKDPRTRERGNVVFYFKDKNTKPDHVAFLVDADTVISKDDKHRVYRCGITQVAPSTYTRHEVWWIPWDRLDLQVVAGPIEFPTLTNPARPSSAVTQVPTVEPASPWAGDTATLKFVYRINNPPAADMQVKAEATLVDATGKQVDRLTKRLSPTRTSPAGGDRLVGGDSFSARVTTPGTHRWLLTITAEQTLPLDEAEVLYEPLTHVTSFAVRGRPSIDDASITALQTVEPGGKQLIDVKFRITGLPGTMPSTAGPPPRISIGVERIGPNGTVTPAKMTDLSALVKGGVRVGAKRVEVTAPTEPGEHRLKLIVRLENVPNADSSRTVREVEWTYTVKDRSQTSGGLGLRPDWR